MNNGKLEDLLEESPMNEFAGFVREDLLDFGLLVIEECAKRAESYAYMSPNFIALAHELRGIK